MLKILFKSCVCVTTFMSLAILRNSCHELRTKSLEFPIIVK